MRKSCLWIIILTIIAIFTTNVASYRCHCQVNAENSELFCQPNATTRNTNNTLPTSTSLALFPSSFIACATTTRLLSVGDRTPCGTSINTVQRLHPSTFHSFMDKKQLEYKICGNGLNSSIPFRYWNNLTLLNIMNPQETINPCFVSIIPNLRTLIINCHSKLPKFLTFTSNFRTLYLIECLGKGVQVTCVHCLPSVQTRSFGAGAHNSMVAMGKKILRFQDGPAVGQKVVEINALDERQCPIENHCPLTELCLDEVWTPTTTTTTTETTVATTTTTPTTDTTTTDVTSTIKIPQSDQETSTSTVNSPSTSKIKNISSHLPPPTTTTVTTASSSKISSIPTKTIKDSQSPSFSPPTSPQLLFSLISSSTQPPSSSNNFSSNQLVISKIPLSKEQTAEIETNYSSNKTKEILMWFFLALWIFTVISWLLSCFIRRHLKNSKKTNKEKDIEMKKNGLSPSPNAAAAATLLPSKH